MYTGTCTFIIVIFWVFLFKLELGMTISCVYTSGISVHISVRYKVRGRFTDNSVLHKKCPHEIRAQNVH